MRRSLRSEEDEVLLPEKWLVAFKNPNSKKNPSTSIFVRQFYAPGFYEAYRHSCDLCREIKTRYSVV